MSPGQGLPPPDRSWSLLVRSFARLACFRNSRPKQVSLCSIEAGELALCQAPRSPVRKRQWKKPF